MSVPTVAKMKCPNCAKVVQFPAVKIGKVAKCPGCVNTITLVDQTAKPKPIPPTTIKAPATVPAVPPAIPNPPSRPTGMVQSQVVRDELPPSNLTTTDGIHRQAERDGASRFTADGQDPAMIQKLLNRVQEICTSSEEPLYMAVQQRPVANFAPDAVVLTNRRAIIFRQKILGRLEFVDCTWLQISGIHMKENLIGATVSVQGHSGHREVVDYLPKVQARRVYRIGQEMEEEMIERRRSRKMEEDRNAANQVTINTAVASSPAPTTTNAGQGDLVSRLSLLKQMFEAGLISEAEFTAKKTDIINSI